MKTITMEELYQKFAHLEPQTLILDVRSADEYRLGHVPRSRNIPHDQVIQHLDELRQYQCIYVHCQLGGRASKAAHALEQAGLTQVVCVAESGMQNWVSAHYPIEK